MLFHTDPCEHSLKMKRHALMVHHGSNKGRCVNWLHAVFFVRWGLYFWFNLQLNWSGGKSSFKGAAGIQTAPTASSVYLPVIDGGTFEPPWTQRGDVLWPAPSGLEPWGWVVYTVCCGWGRHLFHSEERALKPTSADVCCPWRLRTGSRVLRDASFSLPGFPQLTEWTDFLETRTLWRSRPNKQPCLCGMEQETVQLRQGRF